MPAPIDFTVRGPMYSEMLNVTHPEIGIEMNNPAPQGDKFLRVLALMHDTTLWPDASGKPKNSWFSAVHIPPGRINLEDLTPEKAANFRGSRPFRIVGSGHGSQNSQNAITALKFSDPGIDPVTGRRRCILDTFAAERLQLELMTLVGPAKDAAIGTAPGKGYCLDYSATGWFEHLTIFGWFAGLRYLNDHQRCVDLDLRGNGCGVWYDDNPGGLGDQHFRDCMFTDQKLASFMVHPGASMANVTIQGGHSGTSPAWVLRYDPALIGQAAPDTSRLRPYMMEGVYLERHSREVCANGNIIDAYDGNGAVIDYEAAPPNEAAIGNGTDSRYYWSALPNRAAIDVGMIEDAYYRFQVPAWNRRRPDGTDLPAFRAKALHNVRVEDHGGLLATLLNNAGAKDAQGNVIRDWQVPWNGRLVELVDGKGGYASDRIRGVTFGPGRPGDDEFMAVVKRGRGTIGRYELVQVDPTDRGGVQRSTGGRCVGVAAAPFCDYEAWHLIRQGPTTGCRMKVWHEPNSDPMVRTEPWPVGTELKPDPDHPGYATRREGEGDGQYVGFLREPAPAGESYPSADIRCGAY